MHFSLPKGLKQNKGGSEIYKTNGALWLSWDESSECLNYTHLQTQKSKLARMFFFSFFLFLSEILPYSSRVFDARGWGRGREGV